MKVTYVGCKSQMNAMMKSFIRGKTVEVTEEVGNKLLKISGFVMKMDEVAKAELKFNTEREKSEIEKLNNPAKIVENQDEEIELLNLQIEEIVESNKKLKIEIVRLSESNKILNSKVDAAQLTNKK